ncbi:MAG: type II toxin-antitoxin system Phd/YefM family antitoxin [Thermodesulfovibrionales bacterium]|nr:type II toxin-antitoxin system Phd/YefM family antitoxin [Thermodesulfovibrionales bacterium]
MITVDEKTAIVGVSELRGEISKVLKEIRKHHLILTKRNKPVGVIIGYDEYERIKKAEEELEDLTLGLIAKERAGKKGKKTLTLEEAEKKLGLR